VVCHLEYENKKSDQLFAVHADIYIQSEGNGRDTRSTTRGRDNYIALRVTTASMQNARLDTTETCRNWDGVPYDHWTCFCAMLCRRCCIKSLSAVKHKAWPLT